MTQNLWIPGPLPGMNELLAAKGVTSGRYGKRWNAYNALKKRWEQTIAGCCSAAHIQPIQRGWIEFAWCEKAWRRDPDNVSAGKKLVLDAFVSCGVLPNDGPRQILGLTDTFHYGADAAGVEVTLKASGG